MSVIRTPPNLQISNAVTPNSSTNGAAVNTDQTTKVGFGLLCGYMGWRVEGYFLEL